MDFDDLEFRQITRELEKYEGVFAKLWQIGRPIFDNSISTACVTFNKAGQFISFHFNPDFWKSLDIYNKTFIICHECLHLILNHGIRMKGMLAQVANIAEDIVINEMLVARMGFDRKNIDNADKYCWFNTVFDEKNGFPPEFLNKLDKKENFEYYYEILKDQAVEQLSKAIKDGDIILVDGHEGFEGQDMGDLLDEVFNKVSPQELENLKKKIESAPKEMEESEKSKEQSQNKKPGGKQAGSGSGSLVKIIEKRKIIKKKKWETIIKKWWKKMLQEKDKDVESFKRKNKRYEFLSSEFILPAILEEDEIDREKSKIDVICALDSSGSCSHLAQRFFHAAESIPKERFNLRLICFDTQVFDVNLTDRRLYGFGGTSFSCVANWVKQNYYDKNKNPHLFCVTDGFGDTPTIDKKYQNRWNWFLTEGGSNSCIPKECKIYNLADFE